MRSQTNSPRMPTIKPVNISWGDLIAGLSIAGLLLPEAVAYSHMAQLPTQAGIIGLFAGLVMYGLWGSSRFAIVSATSSSAALLAASVAPLANGNAQLQAALSYGLIVVTGVFFILASLARMGGITAFIAKPVLRGFSFALAVVIILHQLGSIVGVRPAYSDTPRYFWTLLSSIEQWNWHSLAVAAGALLLLFGLSRFRYVPAGLVVIALGIVAKLFFPSYLQLVPSVGQITMHLAAPELPDVSNVQWMRLLELGMAMVLIIYAESYGSIRNFALKHGDITAPNRDLMALGWANLSAGLFQGTAVGAGYSATSANEAAGAVSKAAGWWAAWAVFLVLMSFLPLIALLPEPILAAIVIHAVSHSLRWAPLQVYFTWKRDRLVLLTTIVLVFTLGILNGFLGAIAMSLLVTLKTFSESSLTQLGQYKDGHDYLPFSFDVQVKPVEGMLILRPNVPIFFANIDRVVSELEHYAKEEPNAKIILSLEETSDLDGSSLEGLCELVQSFENAKRVLILARLKEGAFTALNAVYHPQPLHYVHFTYRSVSQSVKLVRRMERVKVQREH